MAHIPQVGLQPDNNPQTPLAVELKPDPRPCCHSSKISRDVLQQPAPGARFDFGAGLSHYRRHPESPACFQRLMRRPGAGARIDGAGCRGLHEYALFRCHARPSALAVHAAIGITGWCECRSARAIGRQLWQANYHDHAMRNEEDLPSLARYIVANPLRAGLVARIGDYPLWDAVWLA